HVGFSRDGRKLNTASPGGGLAVWDLATRKVEVLKKDVLPDFNCIDPVYDLSQAITPDGKVGASRYGHVFKERVVRFWDVGPGRLLATLQGHQDTINHLAFRPDGSQLATVSEDGVLKIWEVPTGQLLASFNVGGDFGHSPHLRVAFSGDGMTLVVG